MKKKFLIMTIIFMIKSSLFAQTIMNGGFEYNHAATDMINLSNTSFDSNMDSSKAFGSNGNLDIITSNTYCNSSAMEGNWYVALTGGGTDAFSMKLDTTLVVGNTYTISFYDRYCIPFPSWTGQASPVEIGLSSVDSIFGDSIYTAPSLPTSNWTMRTFSFIATNNGQYITVKLSSGSLLYTWVQVDGFTIVAGTVGINNERPNNFENLFYPNPTTDYLFLSDKNKISSLKIYDIYGMLLLSNDYLHNQNAQEKIDLTDFKNGIYIIYLTTQDNNNIVKRLIINDK